MAGATARGHADTTAAGPSATARVLGGIPEPQPTAVLGYLTAIQRSYEADSKWCDAAAAVNWILGKISAAEDIWDLAAEGAAAHDYCLIPSGYDDMTFFCTDWSNQLLEASGIRNDDGDYFKVGLWQGSM